MSKKEFTDAFELITALFHALVDLLNALGVGTDEDGSNNYSQYLSIAHSTLNDYVVPAIEKELDD